MKLQFKKLHPDAKLPTRGSEHAAGYDLCAVEDAFLYPPASVFSGVRIERQVIRTGLSIAIPPGCYGRIAPRSGLAAKHGIDVLAGVVDFDYRGEILVVLVNLGDMPFSVSAGDRIAQLILESIETPEPEWANELPDTARGENGFGSTGR